MEQRANHACAAWPVRRRPPLIEGVSRAEAIRPRIAGPARAGLHRGTRRLRSAFVCTLLAAALVLGSRPAAAQVAPAAVGGEQQFAVGGMVSAFHIAYGKRWLGGEGVYVDANLNPHLGIEAQALWLNVHQEAETHAATYLAGPRYTFRAMGRLRPYAKFLIGEGTFAFPYGYANGHYLVLSPGGGLDYRVNHRIRLRLCDVEYQRWPGFTFGPMTAYGVSTGLRYAFH